MTDGPREGELFSRNYLRPEVMLSDSIRARRRAYSVFEEFPPTIAEKFVQAVKRQLGVTYPSFSYGYLHADFWVECETRDFLGAVTLVFRLLNNPGWQREYLKELRTIFDQEALHYRIDDAGGVHYLVDAEFSRGTETTIRNLDQPRFAGARQALDDGLKGLTAGHLSGKALIRGVFEAAESVFLVIIPEPKPNRLNEAAVEKHLRPLLVARYQGVPDAGDKVSRVLDTFNKWVKSAHPYRHGASFEDVHEAPLDEAVLSASIGMAFIRYLVQPDQSNTF